MTQDVIGQIRAREGRASSSIPSSPVRQPASHPHPHCSLDGPRASECGYISPNQQDNQGGLTLSRYVTSSEPRASTRHPTKTLDKGAQLSRK